MAEINNMILWSSSDGGKNWYQEPAGDAWYVSTQSSNYRSRYTFTYTPTTSKKLDVLNFNLPIRKSGSDGGTEVNGTLSAYLYIGNSSNGMAIASGSKSITFYYYEQTNHVFEFVIPEDVIITEETTFCVAVFATVFSTTYGATVLVDEQTGYTVTFNSNGIGVTPEPIVGFKIALPVLSAADYTFLGWSTDANATTGVGGTYIATSNVVLYAIWVEKAFVITFDDGAYNITFNSINNLTITTNDLPILEEKGKIFLGWYDINEVKAQAGGLWSSLAISEDNVIYLYSKWDYDIVLVEGQSLANIADAIKEIKGETSDITYNLNEMREALDNIETINFSIIGKTLIPQNPRENTIWVNTEVEITDWGIGSINPFLELRDVDWIEEMAATTTSGFINSSGGISATSASEKEIYIETYFPVKYGTTYTYEHTIAASNSMWLAIVEYTGNYSFKQRLVPVSYVSGTSYTGTYTPSSSDVTAIRLTWSTYGVATTVKFIEKNVSTIIEGTQEGSVWIQTGASSSIGFNALTKGEYILYPISAKQYINGAWIDKPAQSYQNSEWREWVTLLINGTDECIGTTGGWESWAVNICTTGTSTKALNVTYGTDYIELRQPTGGYGGIYVTKNKISCTGKTALKITGEINAFNQRIVVALMSSLAYSGVVAKWTAPSSSAAVLYEFNDEVILEVPDGEYYIAFGIYSTDNQYIRLRKVYLE